MSIGVERRKEGGLTGLRSPQFGVKQDVRTICTFEEQPKRGEES